MSAIARRRPPSGFEWLWVVITLAFMGAFLIVPLVVVFREGLGRGIVPFFNALVSENALAAAQLSLVALLVSVPLNTLFGLAAAWAVTRFNFPGKSWLLALIDLPFAVSPIVVGLSLVLLFGARGWLGEWLLALGLKVIFDPIGIILATVFVTFPFVARELIPLMQAIGTEEELAALSLGARGWQIFWRITLPNIRWGLLYGVIVCSARALGEFGAVSVVSGHIRGETNTLPLHIEILFNEYDLAGAFAVASVLSLGGLLALVAKKLVEWRIAVEESSHEH